MLRQVYNYIFTVDVHLCMLPLTLIHARQRATPPLKILQDTNL